MTLLLLTNSVTVLSSELESLEDIFLLLLSYLKAVGKASNVMLTLWLVKPTMFFTKLHFLYTSLTIFSPV